MRYTITLTANVPIKQLFSGRCVTVMSTGAASEVSLTLFVGHGQQDPEDLGQVGAHFSVFAENQQFTGAELTATVDTVVEVLVTSYRVEALDGARVRLDEASLPIPVQTGIAVAPTDRSSAIVTGALAQQLLAANATRRGYWIQNLSATDNLWLNELGADATQARPSLRLGPGDYYEPPSGGCPSGPVSVIGPTAGQPFSAREW